MRSILKYNPRLIILSSYILAMFLMCLGVLFFILKIQTQYGGDLINLKFNIYEGITEINSARNVWQYLIYGVLFSILNGLAILYIQKRFANLNIQNGIIYWIFGSSIIVISLLDVYLWLVLSVNNVSN
jgi:hypothetical protein